VNFGLSRSFIRQEQRRFILSLSDLHDFRSVKRTKAIFVLIGEKIQDLHGLGRLANMMFTENKAYLIDFDFARKADCNPTDIEGYFVDRLPRHPAALAGKTTSQCHDVHSYWMCYETICKSGTEERTGVCPFATMELALEAITNDVNELVATEYANIAELDISTGTLA
jgi:hypothetical protein